MNKIHEVSVLKQVLDELQQSEARFRTIFENTAVGIGLMGLDRRVISANPALCRMYGRSLEELVGQTPVLVTHPDDYAQSTHDFQELIAGRVDYYQSERRYIRKNGEIFWAHVTMSCVRNANNTPLYIIGMVLDIDDRKRAQLELRQSEARFRAIFENVAIGVAIMSLERKPLAVNPVVEQITGYTAEEMLKIDPISLVIPEDRGMDTEHYQELINGGRDSYIMERRYRRKDGRIIWARVNYSLVRDLSGKPSYLVGMIEDIDEQKRAAERLAAQEAEYRLTLEQKVDERTRELKQTNRRLQDEVAQRQKAERALSEKATQDAITRERTRLARDLHDAVTQTLFSASLIAEVLPDLWEINPGEGRRRLEELRQLTRGALAEMRTLLVELRPNSLIQIPLPDLLRQLCESLIGRARLPIQFTAEGQAEIPAEVQVTLYRIAQEALNNIVKHAKATKVVVTLRMGESIRLVIVDDGSGFDLVAITPDHLGLKIMCERAESVGAHCSIYSQPGEGTQISVTWPSLS